MASQRDEAFEAFYESLSDKGGIGGRELMRKAWEAGRDWERGKADRKRSDELSARER